MSPLLKVVGVFVGSFVALITVQTYQFIKVCDEKRSAAIQMWAEKNDESELVLSAYYKCLRGPASPSEKIITPISFTDCAKNAGSQSLADEIERSTGDVYVPIPLRWL